MKSPAVQLCIEEKKDGCNEGPAINFDFSAGIGITVHLAANEPRYRCRQEFSHVHAPPGTT